MSAKQVCGRAIVAVVVAMVLGWLGSVEPAAGQVSEGHITGTVTADDGGSGLEGICVGASGDDNAYGQAQTGPDGTFDISGLPAGNYTVRFDGNCGDGGYLTEFFDNTVDYEAATPVSVTARETTAGIDAGLAAEGHITGTVTADEGSSGLEGICVTASREDNNGYGQAQTGPDGTFDIGGLPIGNYRVHFYDCSGADTYLAEYFDDTTEYQAARLLPVTAGGATADIDASLASAGHITGIVVGEDGGVALEGICVQAYSPEVGRSGSAETGIDGSYDIGGLPAGPYRVSFSDCGRGAYAPEYFDDILDFWAATVVSVTEGNTTPAVSVELAPAGHITGTVTADDGQSALENICVYASRHDNHSYGSDQTAADGSYDIGGLSAGSFTVSFSDCGNGYDDDFQTEYFDNSPTFSAATPVPVTAGETTADIDASLAAVGHITGTVTAADGGPVEGICVDAGADSGSGSDQTDANGNYDIDRLATGSYLVRFSDCNGSDFVPEYFDDTTVYETATLVEVTAGATTPNVDARLAGAGHITGTVTAQDTVLPLEGACIYASDGAGSSGYADTAADGSYDIGGLDSGTYTVTIEPCGDAVGYAPEYFDDAVNAGTATLVEVVSGETTAGIDVDLAPGGHITGTVTSEETGLPVEGICVTAFTNDFGRGSRPTGPDGTYDIGGLPADIHNVQFEDCSPVGYLPEYFDNATTIDTATPVEVTAAATTPNINAGLTVDGEGDGVSAPIENGAPNGGDGNYDGTPDAEQGNVASLPAAVGSEPYVTVAAPEGTSLQEVSTIDPASLPEPPPAALSFPGGLLSFTVDGVEQGATVEVEVIIGGGASGATQYYKFHDGVWVDYSDNAVFSGDTVTLTLTDGGLGDDDGEPNGQIVDPGGPAVLTGAGPPPPPPPPSALVCNGRAVTVDLAQGQSPTAGADVIRGTPNADVINALGGDDVVCSLGGDDTITGGQGRDRIFAGAGNDTVRTGNGGGAVGGGEGDDTLVGGTGDDALRGRAGDDGLFGRAGNDALHGGTGTDACDGGTGTDRATACEILARVP